MLSWQNSVDIPPKPKINQARQSDSFRENDILISHGQYIQMKQQCIENTSHRFRQKARNTPVDEGIVWDSCAHALSQPWPVARAVIISYFPRDARRGKGMAMHLPTAQWCFPIQTQPDNYYRLFPCCQKKVKPYLFSMHLLFIYLLTYLYTIIDFCLSAWCHSGLYSEQINRVCAGQISECSVLTGSSIQAGHLSVCWSLSLTRRLWLSFVSCINREKFTALNVVTDKN